MLHPYPASDSIFTGHIRIYSSEVFFIPVYRLAVDRAVAVHALGHRKLFKSQRSLSIRNPDACVLRGQEPGSESCEFTLCDLYNASRYRTGHAGRIRRQNRPVTLLYIEDFFKPAGNCPQSSAVHRLPFNQVFLFLPVIQRPGSSDVSIGQPYKSVFLIVDKIFRAEHHRAAGSQRIGGILIPSDTQYIETVMTSEQIGIDQSLCCPFDHTVGKIALGKQYPRIISKRRELFSVLTYRKMHGVLQIAKKAGLIFLLRVELGRVDTLAFFHVRKQICHSVLLI